MSEIEIRTGKAAPVEFRKAAEGSKSPGTLSGYAIVYNSLSRDLGGFVERVLPEATAKSLADQVRVMGRYNHDNNFLLGTTEAGTLRMVSDDKGLRYEIDLPNTSAGRDVAELSARGDLRYSSFAFVVPNGGDDWGFTEQDYPLRTIRAMQLIDVAPVNDPAYLDTTTALRSMAEHMPPKTPAAEAVETEDRSGQRETHPLRDLLASILTDAEQ
jgi:HK97 family phage prohead protease